MTKHEIIDTADSLAVDAVDSAALSPVQHQNIYMALAAAQAAMGRAVKGSKNPAFKSKYADLADVVLACRGALSANGIAYFHLMVVVGDRQCVRTVLAHGASGTTIECDVPIIVQQNNMQGMKSATTYAKRIGLESVTGIAPEDDDGNAAGADPAEERQKDTQKAPEPAPGPDWKHDGDHIIGLVRGCKASTELDDLWRTPWVKDFRSGAPTDIHDAVTEAFRAAKSRLAGNPFDSRGAA